MYRAAALSIVSNFKYYKLFSDCDWLMTLPRICFFQNCCYQVTTSYFTTMWTSLHMRLPPAPPILQSLFRPTTPTLSFLLATRPIVPALPLGLHCHQSRHGSNLA